jgi:hypothetical protein
MSQLTRLRGREARLERKLASAFGRDVPRIAAQLADVRRRIALALPPVERELYNNRWYLVLRRPAVGRPTAQCPFCGVGHTHGLGEGYRARHCRGRGVEIALPDGVTLHSDDGYMVYTG